MSFLSKSNQNIANSFFTGDKGLSDIGIDRAGEFCPKRRVEHTWGFFKQVGTHMKKHRKSN